MARLDDEQFVSLVQSRADLSFDGANDAIDVVLGTLSDRISGGEFDDIVTDLPDGVTSRITYDKTRPAESFDSTEFLQRVSNRLEIDRERAEAITYAVLGVIAETISKEEARDVRSELPGDLELLFQEVSRPTPGQRG